MMLERDHLHAYALPDRSLPTDFVSHHPTELQDSPLLQNDHQTLSSPAGNSPAKIISNGASEIDLHGLREPPLPPTPPHQRNTPGAYPPLHPNTSASDSINSGFATPTNLKSPPTPDETPPRFQEILTKLSSGSFPAASSYAESFQSALEDQASIHTVGSGDVAALQSTRLRPIWPPVQPNIRAATLEDVFNGMDEPLSNPRNVPLRHKPDFEALGKANDRNFSPKLYRDHSPEWGGQFMGNTALLSKTPPSINADDTVSSTLKRSMHGAKRDISSTKDNPADEHLKSSPSPTTPRDFDLKRLSAASTTSTVVEAVVIDHTPPPSKRTLRHVSKTESLRKSASPQLNQSHFDEFLPTSNRGSKNLDLEDHSMFHNSVLDDSPLIHPHFLKRQKGTLSLGSAFEDREPISRPVTAPQSKAGHESELNLNLDREQRRIVSDPLQIMPVSLEDVTPPPPSASPASMVHENGFEDAMTFQPLETSRSNAPAVSPLSGTDSHYGRPSIDPATLKQKAISSESFSTVELHDYHSTRQFYGASPMSLRSETTDNVEINEAAAIQLSSHTNGSLVVIHHTNSNEGMRRRTVADPENRSADSDEGTFITIEPSSPVNGLQHEEIPHSPLRNPRAAPVPPSMSFTSSTPVKELDGSEDKSNSRSPYGAQTEGQGSIFQRARRYSESFMQPFTGGFRRNRNSNSGRQSRADPQPSENADIYGRLHPLWHPKEWHGEASEAEDKTAAYQLPAEFEAQNMVVDQNQQEQATGEKWSRMGSIRGFLIGNTLGLERGPTNKRRHKVVLPSRASQGSTQYSSSVPANRHVTVRQSVKRSSSATKKRGPTRSADAFQKWRERLRQRRLKRQFIRQEKKRAALRESIDGPFEHESASKRAF